MITEQRRPLRRWDVVRLLLAKDVRRPLLRWVAALGVALLVVNALNVVNSYLGRDFMTALSQRDADRYTHLAWYYVCVFAASSAVAALFRFAEERIRLVWREAATRQLIERYLARRTSVGGRVALGLDNPDQRITEDVRAFTGTAVSVAVLTLNVCITSVAFLGVLWSITPWLVAAAFAYSILGSTGAMLLGRPLIQLNNRQLTKEAKLRHQLIRAGGHDDPVAESDEVSTELLYAHLTEVIGNATTIVGVTSRLTVFTGLYSYLLQIIPVLVVAPFYLRRSVEFGVVTQAAMAFSQVMGGLSLIITQYEALSSLATVTSRIRELIEATRAPDVEAPRGA